MDMATIPPTETENSDSGMEDNIIIEDPESEEELRQMLGL